MNSGHNFLMLTRALGRPLLCLSPPHQAKLWAMRVFLFRLLVPFFLRFVLCQVHTNHISTEIVCVHTMIWNLFDILTRISWHRRALILYFVGLHDGNQFLSVLVEGKVFVVFSSLFWRCKSNDSLHRPQESWISGRSLQFAEECCTWKLHYQNT